MEKGKKNSRKNGASEDLLRSKLSRCCALWIAGHQETYKRIVRVDFSYPSSPSPSPEAKDFISRLLMKDPAARMKLSEVANHPWIRANADPKVLDSK